MFGIIGQILSAAIKPITTVVDGWQRRKTVALESELKVTEAVTEAKIDHLKTTTAAEIDWDMMAMQNSSSSWKDEYWVIVLSIPMILSFVPFMVPFVAAGFVALQGTPIWYQSAVGVAIAASFGYRKLADWKFNLS